VRRLANKARGPARDAEPPSIQDILNAVGCENFRDILLIGNGYGAAG